MTEQYYVARVPLLMTQGPGKVPGLIRFAVGQVFALDGDEGFDVQMALSLQQIALYDPTQPKFTPPKMPKAKAKGGKP